MDDNVKVKETKKAKTSELKEKKEKESKKTVNNLEVKKEKKLKPKISEESSKKPQTSKRAKLSTIKEKEEKDRKKDSAKITKKKTKDVVQKSSTKEKKTDKKEKEVVKKSSLKKVDKKDKGVRTEKKKQEPLAEQKIESEIEDSIQAGKVKVSEASSVESQIKMYEKTMETVKSGNVVEGTIIRVDSSEVMIDIGFKAEGIIPISEFEDPEEVQVGNKIWVYIIRKENRQGRPRLSKKKADLQRHWEELTECYNNDKKISGKIIKRVKGGMIVDFNSISAFLPASHISTKTLPNLDHLVGEDSDFKIISFNREKENIVLSRKLVLEEVLNKKKSGLLEKLEEGIEIDGVVKNIMEYGVFVDLGGIDGLLHISDMSWGHINHPSEMLNIGDKIKVKILSFNKENEKVSLGLKQLVPHPWQNIEIKYPEGSKVEGKVTNITNYGAFIELEKGVEGLIHISEMSWTKQITHPKQLLKVGDGVNAIVLSVDKDEHRISLGLKQVEPNPWLTIDVRHPIDSKITGKIKNITNFGAFMEVERDIDGLIHISDLSWTKRILHPGEVLKKGQEVEVVILLIDKVMQRISLGIKQLKPDPWKNIEKDFPINSEHNVKIIKIIPKGALISATEGIEGFIPTSHLGIPGLENSELAFDIGEELPVKVIEVDSENRRLIFSVKTFFFGREEKEVNDFVSAHLDKIKAKRKEREIKSKEGKEAAEKK
ncbi:MAG: 30S ribosomal protein S1 [Candidatus Cloacimonetes bacterium]|nr:30S ribosomal protein S1 [Candidatus Cloacimonadota bacterium]